MVLERRVVVGDDAEGLLWVLEAGDSFVDSEFFPSVVDELVH